ncbi:MAG: S-layer homology domain-containing protein, partial [Oscillospiraceae bacterium]|nr:S-layer homology domain-containing protein [Oscillospiraceae bacterium]
GSPWYQPYVNYAISNNIISSSDFSDYTAKISRADMAYIFYRSLPTSEFGVLNNIYSIPDVNSAPSRDQNSIRQLYYAGVLTGSDSYGTFNPNNNITRAEAAAIISRVAISTERKQVTLLYKVTDGIVTFGIPQTGPLKESTSDGSTFHYADGAAVLSTVKRVSDSSLKG